MVPLKDETTRILEHWLEEREVRDRYNGRDAIWLTQYGNRYNKNSFRTVFRNIAEEAGFDLENRDLTPYSIRHSTGNYIEAEDGLATAAQQLRHKSKETTKNTVTAASTNNATHSTNLNKNRHQPLTRAELSGTDFRTHLRETAQLPSPPRIREYSVVVRE